MTPFTSADKITGTNSTTLRSSLVYASSPVPSKTEAKTGTGDGHNDQTKTTTIVVGVLVPVILIGIAALIFYKWYRKKYPVRMGIGRNFSTFSNPAYNKRQSVVNMAGEDKENVFNALSRRNPQMADVAEVEDVGHTNPGFDDDDENPESINTSESNADFDSIDGNVAKVVEVQDISVETDQRPERSLKNISRDGTRKRATLIRTYDMERVEIDAAFEYASESDLGKRTESEISYGNESTDTHTISISFAESFDNRLKIRSKSEDLIVRSDSSTDSTDEIELKERSKSDTNRLLNVREQKEHLAQLSASEKENTYAQSKTPSIEEFETFELITQVSELTELRFPELQNDSVRSDNDNGAFNTFENVIEQNDFTKEFESAKGKQSHTGDFLKSETEINDKQSFKSNSFDNENDENTSEISSMTIGFEILDSEINATKYVDSNDNMDCYNEDDISYKINSNSTSMEHLNPEQLISAFPKRLSLSLSSEHIFLERRPQSVLVQDTIIFEPETPNPVHLDCTPTVSPRRGRRAFTLNDISEKINYSRGSSDNKSEKISTSSPQINTPFSGIPDYSFFPKPIESNTSNFVDTQDVSVSQPALNTSSVDSVCNIDNRNASRIGEAESGSIDSTSNDSENDELVENNMSFVSTTAEVYSESDKNDDSDNADMLEDIQTPIFGEIPEDEQSKQTSNQTSNLRDTYSNESNPNEFSKSSTLIGIDVDESNLVEITVNAEINEISFDRSNLEDIIQPSTINEIPVDKSNIEETIILNTLEDVTRIKAGPKSKILAGDFKFDAHYSSSDSDDSSGSSSVDEDPDDKDPSNNNTMDVTVPFWSDRDNYQTEHNFEEQVMENNPIGRSSHRKRDTAHENTSSKEQDHLILMDTDDLKDDNPDDIFRKHKFKSFEITDEKSDESNSEC
ncbi:dentin sialophosphoprotein-like [Dreissena polymorpha]|uniref:Uncharacterized protein n=1 Tax=Dreissena polymorpha TaxID=45954 RepID=A0A9D4D547_DREPO|nr:dentin sialophosphoprotein-like [Dreissena polymorpha]XP_052241696.1 dentin sialophosphoprotein-like [Dreissena polymorpha]XP_052241698.1 dentin sialophosphoprotein-like [Dreissena polymorpha]XP_052241699.1 dentin sialophosphoprotein-like [Dreissena polymorpha]XP_052241700.1 dentin sialophosphoprotein-like [Dreissena polymorpha]KAH3738327.1 hypothetical protein DPMN_044961 [Dreissena polymorpha]